MLTGAEANLTALGFGNSANIETEQLKQDEKAFCLSCQEGIRCENYDILFC